MDSIIDRVLREARSVSRPPAFIILKYIRWISSARVIKIRNVRIRTYGCRPFLRFARDRGKGVQDFERGPEDR